MVQWHGAVSDCKVRVRFPHEGVNQFHLVALVTRLRAALSSATKQTMFHNGKKVSTLPFAYFAMYGKPKTLNICDKMVYTST